VTTVESDVEQALAARHKICINSDISQFPGRHQAHMGMHMVQAFWFIPGRRIFLLVLRLVVLRKM
jgi:hypothetical protein